PMSCFSFDEPCRGACRDGVCDPDLPAECPDDGDPCTEEVCDPTIFGCTSRPVPGCCHPLDDCDDDNTCTRDRCGPDNVCVHDPLPCWAIRGRVTATASAKGRSATRSRRFQGILMLFDNGTYRSPNGACPVGGGTLPDEVGMVRADRRGRLHLEAT